MSHSTLTPHQSWQVRIRQSAVTRLLVAVAWIGVPLVAANALVRLLPAGADMAPLRNGIKIVVLVLAYLGFVRWIEKRSPFELSLPGAFAEIGAGILLGAVLISLSVAVLAGVGAYRVESISDDVPWLRYVAGFFAVALMEELIFRAVLFRLLEQPLGSGMAIALSAAIFGLAHAINPNATWVSIASLSMVSTILVAAFMLTRRVWLCVGLHWGWNLCQALYSVPVSGSETTGLLNGYLTGPGWLTGGDFGIEASLPTLLLCLLVTGLLLYRAEKRGRFIAPYWKTRAIAAA